MKNYDMRLQEEPFENIVKGVKKIEYRLNDEKRKELRIGDTITFYKRPLEQESITVIITDLKYYDNLLDMYEATFEIDFKDRYENPQAVVDDTPYYSEEEIEECGCVAIHFEKIHN